jgi:DNA-binding GntR family transcriptional regulator
MAARAPAVRLERIALNQTSTAEQIAGVLRQMIVSGEIAPGSRLPENTLASSFSVSRNTVREALRELERQGIVRHNLHRSVVVTEMTVDDVADIFRVRRMLELAAAGTRLSGAGPLQALEASLDRLRHAAESSDMPAITEADLDFHRSLVGLLQSPRLHTLFETLRLELLLCLSIVDMEARDDPSVLVAEHEELFDLLARGDRRGLRKALDIHLADAEQLVLGVIRARADGAQRGNTSAEAEHVS